MPNDAKLGLVVGVGLTVAVAVVFFPKVPDSGPPRPAQRPVYEVNPPAADGPVSSTDRRADGHTVSRTKGEARLHVVAPGDTLFNLAQRFYGDGGRFIDLYQANRELIRDPERLPVGATLRVP
jgi:nucleoid-associated protein YgaU